MQVLIAFAVTAAMGMAGWEWRTVAARMQPTAAQSEPPPTATAGAPTQAVHVSFRWAPSPDTDVTGYLVSWGDKPGVYTSTSTVGPTSTSIELSLMRRPEPYYVAVQARNVAGALSAYSNEFSLDVFSGRPRATKVKKAPKPKREKPAKKIKEKKQKRKSSKASPP
jgi:hypothetical protein